MMLFNDLDANVVPHCAAKLLFLHGLDSSRESSKFDALCAERKFCINIDYRNLSYQAVADFYDDIIEQIRPDILVGHSLGGYWAIRMSLRHQLPCVIANPSLHPDFRQDYPAIHHFDLDHDIPQFAYIERGDEILDMQATEAFLENYMQVEHFSGGHHRLAHPERINALVVQIEKYHLGLHNA